MQQLNYVSKSLTTPEYYEMRENYQKMRAKGNEYVKAYQTGPVQQEIDDEVDAEMDMNRRVLRGDLWENLKYFK